MGQKQSKLNEAAIQSQVEARLRALHIRQAPSEKEYVMTEGSAPPPYGSMSRDVSINAVEQWEQEALSDPKNKLGLLAFTNNDAKSILKSRSALIADQQVYNITIPLEGSPITNQRQSGRCWLFASTNVFRVPLMKKYDLKEFQLSQAYLFYWDKLEKANYLYVARV